MKRKVNILSKKKIIIPLPKEEDRRQNCQTYVIHIYKFVTGLNHGFEEIVYKSGLSTGFTGGEYDKDVYVKHVMS